MQNALTVDIEDYFHVTAFERHVSRDNWDSYPLRVVDNTRRVLHLFDEFNVKATFFILGWVAERAPDLVQEIARRGHEIACHGYGHELVFRIGPEKFRHDVRRAKNILENITGKPVFGYRAPSYSITGESLWALDILIEEGFTYDSSIFPVAHDIYGIPGAQRFPHCMKRQSGEIVEFPMTTLPIRMLGREFRLPIAGGGYLRLLPTSVIDYGIRRINAEERQPAVLYFHPWEIDPGQPRIRAGFKSRFRHYLNLHRTEGKLRNLLDGLGFCPMEQVLHSCPLS